ncbi:hypothetical protein [Terriglobus sp. ADX1]|uniref:hypothetical protein n=1 Tax=Terriglobus sp. ADX1 TaxID=2794063 RepID=UPI002FE637C9
MGIFARRYIQRALDELALVVAQETINDWVRRLNMPLRDYSAIEWEVAIVHCLSGLGKLHHEPSLGTSRIDIVFSRGTLNFGADCVAISDHSQHERNPIEVFLGHANNSIRSAGITTGRFTVQINEEQPSVTRFHNRRKRLQLPPVTQMKEILQDEEFQDFLRVVKTTGIKASFRLVRKSPQIDVAFIYESGIGNGHATVGAYVSYTSTTAKDDNPLFNALKSKAKQLKKSGYVGLRGIIVCDRDATILREMSNWSTFTKHEVVNEFFRQNSSVNFVLTIAIDTSFGVFSRFERAYKAELFVNANEIPNWATELKELFDAMVVRLPAIQQTPQNSDLEMKHHQATITDAPYRGGWSMKYGTGSVEVTISTRELLDLFAGRLSFESFDRHHTESGKNVFARLRESGHLISGVSVEKCRDEDDDKITFLFGPKDAAVAKFQSRRRDS